MRPSVFAAAIACLLTACATGYSLVPDDSNLVLAHQSLAAPDPADSGASGVKFLYYGSGNDRQRREYRDSVSLKTTPVDASLLLAGIDAKKRKDRAKYWGFDFDKLPRNARVWYPDGAGPFPLVLIVHGNHDMKKFSDPGYEYLGTLLASRGFIAASVDENFLNGSIRGENNARGWMLLEHLKLWRDWNVTEGNPFFHKVDTANIALIGHSRGGEAVVIAAAFNTLPRNPDDANLAFDFHFAIKSLVALAPIDGQFNPAGRSTPLTNVDYLVLQGAHDGDVSAFSGERAYNRLKFTDGQPHFKSALFIYRANHSRFNTSWGLNDAGDGDEAWYLDLRPILKPEEQRQIAKVYLSAYLEATLHGKREYLPMFRDHRLIGGWLPKTIYVTQFEESGVHMVSNYEEDIDVTTTSVAGGRLTGEHLAVWKEQALALRWTGNTPQQNDVVRLGWNRRDTSSAKMPTYSITLPDSLTAWHVDSTSTLLFNLADLGQAPPARKEEGDSAASPKEVKSASAPKDTSGKANHADLTVELVSANGASAALPLSELAPIRPPLTVRVTKWNYTDRKMFSRPSEIVLQTYALPLNGFVRANPSFDPSHTTIIRFRFDRTRAGTIALDEIGFSSNSTPTRVAGGTP